MRRANVMYKDRWMSVVYSPNQDRYIFFLNSTMNSGNTTLFLDQRLIDEFSRNDVNHLSNRLPLIGAEDSLSRTDVERIHGAIVGTMEKFLAGLQDFRECCIPLIFPNDIFFRFFISLISS